tara:strand:+ start:370 stop:1296 length:927 start_codon:yes stop_codon:yes gene_type:complete
MLKKKIMEKLDPYRLLKTYLCLSSIIFLLKSNVFAQTYHDCTSTQDFNNLLDQNSSSEEMLDLMELELAKSLSKFDKCVDSDYLETKNKKDQNKFKNSEKLENSAEELSEQKKQEGEGSDKEIPEKGQEGEGSKKEMVEKGQEGEDFEKEVVKQEAKDTKEELSEKKPQEIDKQEGKSEKVNNEYNSFSSKNNREEFLNNRNNNNKRVDSVASSELSGTEITEENVEATSAFENTTSEDIVKYENDQRFDQGETNTNNGIIPEDIPQDDNDSVLEEQIRLAAMNEKDPEKKKRLWNEYRKYKGLPQKE